MVIDGPIAAVAPSGAFDPARFEAGLALAREAGFDVVPLPDLMRPERYLAAPDAHRLAQLVDALTDPRWSAVWMVRGGYGLGRLLGQIPWDRLPRRPVLGFSDATALFAGLYAADRGPCVHAPVLHSLGGTDDESRAATWALLRGEPPAPMAGTTWVDGEAEGPVLGGNLTMFASLCGTPWAVHARGHVVLLEDVGEAPYRLDRAIGQLRQAGFFDGVLGVALGEFSGCKPPEGATWSLDDALSDLRGLGVPVIAGLPVGHAARNRPFVWGSRVRLGDGALSFEPA